MYDKDLIERVCSLSCSRDDVARSQTAVKYDTEHPFKKYYSLNTVKGACDKYLRREWDDRFLANFACIYLWVLSGGFDDGVVEDLSSIESFLKDLIVDDLDSLSFFYEDYTDDEPRENIKERIKLFESYDYILATQSSWRAVYAMIGPFAEENGDQFVMLINDNAKEYMIIYSDFIDNGYADARFSFVSADEHIALEKKLRSDGYTLLSHSEEYYYSVTEE
ncbi:MAG: hypothetical protein IJF38_07210 [Clostridia bacterium]|nr:hypothetical protein [Clostridia bacterium]